MVIEADKVAKSYGDNILLERMTFSLPRGGIVGIIGPNGAGKTTLFRMIIGQEKPDASTIRVSESVKLAYVDQNRETLEPKENHMGDNFGGTITLSGLAAGRSIHVHTWRV